MSLSLRFNLSKSQVGGPRPSWVAIVTPTDRPKSVCSRCVMEVFGGLLVLLCFFLDFSVGVGAFVIGLSQISSFLAHLSRRLV